MNPDPSIRIRCSFSAVAATSAGTSAAISMSAGVIGSWVQDIQARAIWAHHLLAGDAHIHPRVTQRTASAIAGDGARIDMDDLGRGHRRLHAWGGGVHCDPRSGLESGAMIAMR